jgi:hypothetical protein
MPWKVLHSVSARGHAFWPQRAVTFPRKVLVRRETTSRQANSRVEGIIAAAIPAQRQVNVKSANNLPAGSHEMARMSTIADFSDSKKIFSVCLPRLY